MPRKINPEIRTPRARSKFPKINLEILQINPEVRPPRDRDKIDYSAREKGCPNHQNYLRKGVLDSGYLCIQVNA